MATYTWNGGTSTAWATAANWTPTGPPATGDTAIFDGTATGGVAGSDQSAVTLATLLVKQTFGSSTILFGSNGTPLKVGVSGEVRIGDPSQSPASSSGSQRINLDTAASAPTITVVSSANVSADTGKEVVRLRVNNASAILNVLSGSVGIATDNASDTSTIPAVNVSGGTCNLGSGATLTTVVNNGGAVTVRSAVTTLSTFSGTTTTFGSGLVGTLNAVGGTVSLQHRTASGNSVTTLNLRGGNVSTASTGQSITIGSTSLRTGSIQAFSDSQITFSAVSIDFDSQTKVSVSR